MPTLSLTPISSKTLKDCFKSQVEYSFASAGTEEVKKKIPVLHNVADFEALLIWRTNFEELAGDKGWNWVSMFINVRLLLSGPTKLKWIACCNIHNTGRTRGTEAAWHQTMQAFMLRFCTKTDTEKLRDLIMNARKPSAMSVRDFTARVEELNLYLPYLPPPFNTSLDDVTLTLIIRRSVPTWNNSLIRSASRMTTVQEITSYYQDLELMETTQNIKFSRLF